MPSSVEIGWRTQLTSEYRPWSVEFATEMDPGDAINAVSSTLTDLLTGLSFPAGLPTTPTFSGTIVTQPTANLLAGHNYRLVLLANMGGAKTSAVVLLISVPY